MLHSLLHGLFWTCFALVIYVYLAYPAMLWLITGGRQRSIPPVPPDDELPTISMIIAAYNEEVVIEEKVRNCLRLDYPDAKLTCLFVTDSTDRTNEILLRHKGGRIDVEILPERRGKVAALAAAYPRCTGEILVYSDANTLYRPDTLKKLVRHFADPRVGVVTGDVRLLPSPQGFGRGERLYYRYERSLQKLESAFHSTVGIDGAMYALRQKDLQPVLSGFVCDDFVTAMNVARQGFQIIYDDEAIAEEDPTPTDEMEFRRKLRIVAHVMQSLMAGEGVPTLRQYSLWWIYGSHKLLRWLVPFFLIGMLVTNVAAAFRSDWWRLVLVLQLGFYATAILGWRFPKLHGWVFRASYYFCMVNLAAFLGVLRAMTWGQHGVWDRTERNPTTGTVRLP